MSGAVADRPAALTRRQRRVVAFVRRHVADYGYSPTRREIADGLGFRSVNAVAQHLASIARKGHVRLTTGSARGVQLVGPAADGFRLPLLGLVAAGPAIEAEAISEQVDLAELFGGDELFAVRVRGDGLAPELVSDGDCLVLRPLAGRRDAWRTVAAEVRGAFGLYDYVPRRASQRTQPADAFRLMPRAAGGEPVSGPGDGVRILGVLAGVLRRD